MKPSAEAVLALLRDRPAGVTGLEALYAGCGDRLPARIGELKAAGHEVTDSWETTPNGARVKRFRLVERPARSEPGPDGDEVTRLVAHGQPDSLWDWAPGELQEAYGR